MDKMTQEEKAKFVALYWGQNIGIGTDTNGMTERIHVGQKFTLPLLDKTHLLLTPISLITDEHAKELDLKKGMWGDNEKIFE